MSRVSCVYGARLSPNTSEKGGGTPNSWDSGASGSSGALPVEGVTEFKKAPAQRAVLT